MSPFRETSCEVWRPPACAFTIETSAAVLDQLRREAGEGLHAPRGEYEIGGVLFGLTEPDRIRILASRPLYLTPAGHFEDDEDNLRPRGRSCRCRRATK